MEYPQLFIHKPKGLVVEFTSLDTGKVLSCDTGEYKVGLVQEWNDHTAKAWTPYSKRQRIMAKIGEFRVP